MNTARWLLVSAVAVAVYLPTLLWHKIGVATAGLWLNQILEGTGLRVSWHRLFFHDWVRAPRSVQWWVISVGHCLPHVAALVGRSSRSCDCCAGIEECVLNAYHQHLK